MNNNIRIKYQLSILIIILIYNSQYIYAWHASSEFITCPRYICGQIPVNIERKKNNEKLFCQYYDLPQRQFIIENCPDDSYECLPHFQQFPLAEENIHGYGIPYQEESQFQKFCEKKSEIKLPYRLIDENCLIDDDCYSGVCGNEKKCSFKTEGQKCTHCKQCDKNLQCINDRCQKVQQANQICNKNLNDCKYGALCAKIADSEYYTCINYLSVNEDVKVSSEFPEKNHKVCKSLAFDNITNTCSPIESTKDGWPKHCHHCNQCYGIFNSKASCSCDEPNEIGMSVCQGFLGDRKNEHIAKIEFYSRSFENCYFWEISDNFYDKHFKSECVINKYYDNRLGNFAANKGNCFDKIGLNLSNIEPISFTEVLTNFVRILSVIVIISLICYYYQYKKQYAQKLQEIREKKSKVTAIQEQQNQELNETMGVQESREQTQYTEQVQDEDLPYEDIREKYQEKIENS